MATLWIDGNCMSIRSYRASTNGTKARVMIEVEVSDPMKLGFFLTDLAEVKCSIDTARQAKAQAEREEKRKAKEPRAIGQKKMLALPFYGGDQS